MPEDSIDSIVSILSDLFGAVQHFGERITVQRQLAVILFIGMVAWVLTSV